MTSSGFLAKASERVIAETKALLVEKEEHLEKVNQRLKEL
jgi:valyl-tRNA synthetase